MSDNRFRAWLEAMPEKSLALDSPVYGDERERRVILEGISFAYTIALFVGLVSAVITACAGHVFISTLLVGISVIPAMAASGYMRQRGVDLDELVERDPRARRRSLVWMGALLGCWLLALAALLYRGQPLLPSWDVVAAIYSLDDSVAHREGIKYGVSGGVAGLVVLTVWEVFQGKRRSGRRRPNPE